MFCFGYFSSSFPFHPDLRPDLNNWSLYFNPPPRLTDIGDQQILWVHFVSSISYDDRIDTATKTFHFRTDTSYRYSSLCPSLFYISSFPYKGNHSLTWCRDSSEVINQSKHSGRMEFSRLNFLEEKWRSCSFPLFFYSSMVYPFSCFNEKGLGVSEGFLSTLHCQLSKNRAPSFSAGNFFRVKSVRGHVYTTSVANESNRKDEKVGINKTGKCDCDDNSHKGLLF